MNTHEYNDRYERIITAWEAPDTESHGEQAVLMDGYRRYVRRDGLICVTLVKTDNTSVADSELTHEEALLEEVGQFPKASLPSPTERAAPAGALPVEVSDETKGLIRASVSENTEKNYRYWSSQIELWLMGRVLDDGLLAAYITELHQSGKSPATISQAVASVRWLARNNGVEIVGEITVKTLSGIRRAGKDRGRGQVDGLTWSEVERVCAFAEMEGSVAGLRDSALIRLMSDCLLRVSEAVAVNCGDLKDKTLVVKSSKTDQEGRGEVLYVTSDTRWVIKRYREMAGIAGGPCSVPLGGAIIFRRGVCLRGLHVGR